MYQFSLLEGNKGRRLRAEIILMARIKYQEALGLEVKRGRPLASSQRFRILSGHSMLSGVIILLRRGL